MADSHAGAFTDLGKREDLYYTDPRIVGVVGA